MTYSHKILIINVKQPIHLINIRSQTYATYNGNGSNKRNCTEN